jgi:thiosulfate/3-mercaptopyruvate sulfurtransferase
MDTDSAMKYSSAVLKWVLRWGTFLLLASLPALVDSDSKTQRGPKSEWLVDVIWLNEHLKDKDLIIVDTRSQKEYSEGHIPGAIWLDLSDLAAKTNQSGLEELKLELEKRFSLLGINGSEKVIFYEEAIGLRAPRALWFLLYSGYPSGKVLYGGLAAWRGSNFPLGWERTVRPSRPYVVKENREVLASIDYVASRIKNPGCVILDVRSREEYSGQNSYNQNSRSGRIPGAVWLEWKELLDDTLNFKPLADLQKRLEQAGATPDKEIITYCYRGNRSSNTYLALRVLGYPRVKNYIGSWNEWATRLDLPLEKDEVSSNP